MARRATPSNERSQAAVQSVDRALSILEVLGEDADGYTLKDLAARTGLSPSTAHRLLTALEARRFALCDRQTALWHVGPQTFTIGATFVRRRNFVAAALPRLRLLRDATRETANLGVECEGELIVLAQVESRETVRSVSPVGGHAPLTVDALGKAILSTYAADDIAAIVRRHGFSRRTQTSIGRASQLDRELADVRERGYAVDRGESLAEMHCVASPVCGADGRALAAISVSGLASRMPEPRLAELGAILRDAADDLTRSLGGRRLTEART